MRTSWVVLTSLLSCMAGAVAALPVAAELRDPTELPQVLRQAPAAEGTEGAAATADITVQQLMVVGGRYFVVIGGRRLRVGDKLGTARIARIGDSAVWLTEDGMTRKQSLFAGVEKRPERASVLPEKLPKTAKTAQAAQRTAHPSKEEP